MLIKHNCYFYPLDHKCFFSIFRVPLIIYGHCLLYCQQALHENTKGE